MLVFGRQNWCLILSCVIFTFDWQVKAAYTQDSAWRNRSTFLDGRNEIRQFLKAKWERELDYRLIKEIWAHGSNRIAVRFAYEYHDERNNWYRAYGTQRIEYVRTSGSTYYTFNPSVAWPRQVRLFYSFLAQGTKTGSLMTMVSCRNAGHRSMILL